MPKNELIEILTLANKEAAKLNILLDELHSMLIFNRQNDDWNGF